VFSLVTKTSGDRMLTGLTHGTVAKWHRGWQRQLSSAQGALAGKGSERKGDT